MSRAIPQSSSNKLIYIPDEGMPIIVHQTHIYARSILEGEFTYIELPAISGVVFLMYFPVPTKKSKQNQWLNNIYNGAGYSCWTAGPVLVVATRSKDEIKNGKVVWKAGDVIIPDNFHLQLLPDAIYQESMNRANLIKLSI